MLAYAIHLARLSGGWGARAYKQQSSYFTARAPGFALGSCQASDAIAGGLVWSWLLRFGILSQRAVNARSQDATSVAVVCGCFFHDICATLLVVTSWTQHGSDLDVDVVLRIIKNYYD